MFQPHSHHTSHRPNHLHISHLYYSNKPHFPNTFPYEIHLHKRLRCYRLEPKTLKLASVPL
uniref:Uncharacterized protein MANES_01G273200 n=1 Tax=Rhizophora mucronata TaxID=61149 RepID=A0A2P2PQU5_RHIMU